MYKKIIYNHKKSYLKITYSYNFDISIILKMYTIFFYKNSQIGYLKKKKMANWV